MHSFLKEHSSLRMLPSCLRVARGSIRIIDRCLTVSSVLAPGQHQAVARAGDHLEVTRPAGAEGHCSAGMVSLQSAVRITTQTSGGQTVAHLRHVIVLYIDLYTDRA